MTAPYHTNKSITPYATREIPNPQPEAKLRQHLHETEKTSWTEHPASAAASASPVSPLSPSPCEAGGVGRGPFLSNRVMVGPGGLRCRRGLSCCNQVADRAGNATVRASVGSQTLLILVHSDTQGDPTYMESEPGNPEP